MLRLGFIRTERSRLADPRQLERFNSLPVMAVQTSAPRGRGGVGVGDLRRRPERTSARGSIESYCGEAGEIASEKNPSPVQSPGECTCNFSLQLHKHGNILPTTSAVFFSSSVSFSATIPSRTKAPGFYSTIPELLARAGTYWRKFTPWASARFREKKRWLSRALKLLIRKTQQHPPKTLDGCPPTPSRRSSGWPV
ncbi:Trim46 protein [Anopheles sinensis]|uniref:Trim46 protein n=1 Tax=Anopheles sinensis TaxID=74873 RepID=A0A084WD17_ANOSI|nr:Trim46 protein [Anopheles sinensis]